MDNKNDIFWLLIVATLLVIGLSMGVKSVLLVTGIFSGLMYFNIILTTICNVFNGQQVQSDLFWRITLIIICAITLGIGIVL